MVQLNPVPVFSAKKIPVTFDGNNGKENFGSFRKNRKTVITQKVLLFSGKFPPLWTVPFEFSPKFLGFPYKW